MASRPAPQAPSAPRSGSGAAVLGLTVTPIASLTGGVIGGEVDQAGRFGFGRVGIVHRGIGFEFAVAGGRGGVRPAAARGYRSKKNMITP